MRSLDETVIFFVSNKLTSDEDGEGFQLWKILKKKLIGSSIQSRGTALDQFIDLKFKSIEQWIDELRDSTRKFEVAGYKTLMAVVTSKERYPTIEEIINNVEYSHVQFGKSTIRDEVAMNAKVHPRKKPGKFHNYKKDNQQSISQAMVSVKALSNDSIAYAAYTLPIDDRDFVGDIYKATLLDSGANNHMFDKKLDFNSYKTSGRSVLIGQEGSRVAIPKNDSGHTQPERPGSHVASEYERKESSQVMQLEGFIKFIGFFNGTTIPLIQKPALNGNVYFDCKKRNQLRTPKEMEYLTQ
ncbi:hypothetical protein BY996DRAFT_6519774 [Phakopsora pachyrhizi]|nr:hypothetical protein BY996DRAFT_6519774 [Phakopsora pachyrhizi]